MYTRKYYNPNNFNAVHASVAYLAFWGMWLAVSLIISALAYAAGNFDFWLLNCFSTILLSAGLFLLTLLFSLSARVHPLNGGGFLIRKGCGTEILMTFVLVFGFASLLIPLSESFSVAGTYISEAVSGPIQPGGGSGLEIDMDGSVGWMLLYTFIFVPLLPAIFEELLFRGVILRGFLQFGKVPAVVLSSLMFAMAHGSYQQFIYQFLLALVIGFLVLETKNLFVGMVAHFANNFFASWGMLPTAMAMSWDGDGLPVYAAIVSLMQFLIGAVCVVAAVVYFGKRLLHMQKNPERSCGDVRAAFVVGDMVSGSLLEEKPWYDCGALTPKGMERRQFLRGDAARGRLNGKAGNVASFILIGVGLLIAVIVFITSFLAV